MALLSAGEITTSVQVFAWIHGSPLFHVKVLDDASWLCDDTPGEKCPFGNYCTRPQQR